MNFDYYEDIYVKSLLELSNQFNELNRYIGHIDVP
jgi:hypothetical protein